MARCARVKAMPSPAVHHTLLIRHPTRALVLLVHNQDGYALPTIATEDRHTAEVDYINTAVEAVFGLTTTFLRSLSHGDTSDGLRVDRCHELVARTAAVPRTSVWCESSVLPEIVSLAAQHEPKDGRDWERTNWWHEAAEWIDRQLGAASITAIVQ